MGRNSYCCLIFRSLWCVFSLSCRAVVIVVKTRSFLFAMKSISAVACYPPTSLSILSCSFFSPRSSSVFLDRSGYFFYFGKSFVRASRTRCWCLQIGLLISASIWGPDGFHLGAGKLPDVVFSGLKCKRRWKNVELLQLAQTAWLTISFLCTTG